MSRIYDAIARAANRNGLVLHGTAVTRNGAAYLFLAPSGGGKSTVADLAEEIRMPVLGDEAVLLLERDGALFACPLPRHKANANLGGHIREQARVAKLFFLAKADTVRASPIGPIRAASRCIREDLVIGFREEKVPTVRQLLLDRLIRLFRAVPAYILYFRKDNSFWKVIDELEACGAALPVSAER